MNKNQMKLLNWLKENVDSPYANWSPMLTIQVMVSDLILRDGEVNEAWVNITTKEEAQVLIEFGAWVIEQEGQHERSNNDYRS